MIEQSKSVKKVLFVANIAKHILRFHLPYLKWFKEQGYETHVAANGDEEIPWCDVKHNIAIERSPFSIKNIHAHRELKRIIDENDFALVHGHTPMGGVLARTASAASRKKGTTVLYTAHGFHFYKGSPLKYWFMYYPVEKYLASFTDGIITINREDYRLLIDKKFRVKEKYFINGVGVNPAKFVPVVPSEKIRLRHELGYTDKQFILVYVAEFIHRKNHRFVIDAAVDLMAAIPDLKILFAGRGVLLEEMKNYAQENGVSEVIDFLGFRSDIEKVMAIADIGISASRQEGLGLNLVEEMFLGLPIVASQDRGHRELVVPGENGFIYNQNNKSQFIEAVNDLYSNQEKRILFGKRSSELAQKFSLDNSVNAMAEIYTHFLGK